MPRLSIVVPAYNEVCVIARSLASIATYFQQTDESYEIIVVADGNDGTRELVADLAERDGRLQVLGSTERGGKGRAVRAGVQRSRGEIVGFVDADNKTPIEELGKLLPWFDRGYDVVIGSRALLDSKIEVRQPLYRRIGSRAFAGVLRLLIGLEDVRDTQCGFKFFRAAAAKDIFTRQRIDGYMFDIEILGLAQRLGFRMKEVGIRWLDDGDTRYNPIGGTWRNGVELLRIRAALRRGE